MNGIYTRQTLKERVMNMLEYRTVPCRRTEENKVGNGGNGQVYLTDDGKQVCKVFHVDHNLSQDKVERRYKRFCNEIQVQKKLAESMLGVLAVYDYSFPEEYSSRNPAWFTMPKANQFNVFRHHTLQHKLEELIELGEIIEQLHERRMAHRDIKPENVLVYQNHLCLSDYGLVWIDGENALTQSPERMGPIRIMPPELETCEDINGCDYRKSDVYLFAKVSWMYIKGDNNGFKGPYSRGSHQIYLEKETYGCVSFEPFHLMMLGATKDNWEERLDISGCLELLRQQLMMACGRLPNEMQQRYCLQEKFLLFDDVVQPDYKSYYDSEKISALFSSLIPGVEVEFSDGLERRIVKPKKYKILADNLMALYIEEPDRRMSRILFNTTLVEKHSDKIVFTTASLEEEAIKKYQQMRDTVIKGKNWGYISTDFCTD